MKTRMTICCDPVVPSTYAPCSFSHGRSKEWERRIFWGGIAERKRWIGGHVPVLYPILKEIALRNAVAYQVLG